jgi:hypothetical protein
VQAHCAAEQHLPIPVTAPVWASIPPCTISFLATVAHQPTIFDVAPFLANGVLALSQRGDFPPMKTCANYVRQIAVPGDMATESPSDYLCAYPADGKLPSPADTAGAGSQENPRGLSTPWSKIRRRWPSWVRAERATSQTHFPYNGMTASY